MRHKQQVIPRHPTLPQTREAMAVSWGRCHYTDQRGEGSTSMRSPDVMEDITTAEGRKQFIVS